MESKDLKANGGNSSTRANTDGQPDRYRLDSLLGEGDMGAAFKGFDEVLHRPVAIKVMHDQFACRPDFQKRFLREARSAARINHPGVVQVYDFGQVSPGNQQVVLFIVMEFIEGDNLHDMMTALRARQRCISLSKGVRPVRQLCLAVEAAHHQGILHRDIKPANIILRPTNSVAIGYEAVLTDLGLARPGCS